MNTLESFDRIVEKGIAAREMTCASYTVSVDGEVVCGNALGLADIAASRPLKESDLMRIASMTKPLTCAAVLRARELGLLGLDDEVSRYLPGFAHTRTAEFDAEERMTVSHPTETPITVRMLLNHSSGLNSRLIPCRALVEAGPDATLASIVPRYAEHPLQFEPGTKAAYGNLGFDVACRIVEIVSGMEYEQFLRKHILDPLGMADTTYAPNDEQRSRLATMYFCKGGDPVPAQHKDMMLPHISSTFKAGGMRIFSTLTDYTRFAAMLCCGGIWRGTRVLEPESVRLMATQSLPPALWGESESWGLSVRVIHRQSWPEQPLPPGSFGWSGSYETHFFIIPEQRISAVLFKNIAGGLGAGSLTARDFEREVVSEFIRRKRQSA